MTSIALSRGVAVALLLAMAGQRYFVVRKTADVERYQQRIREVAEQIPRVIDGWVGRDAPVPVQAATVLKPNVMLSRRYLNIETGVSVGVMLVHCADAHHMVGHFPLRCYPSRGWDVQSTMPRDWTVGDLTITGTEYQFGKSSLTKGDQSIIVANCLLRPGHLILRDMAAMSETLTRAGSSASGAAQLQVYFDPSVPQAQRDRAFATLVTGYRPLLDAILSEPEQAKTQGASR